MHECSNLIQHESEARGLYVVTGYRTSALSIQHIMVADLERHSAGLKDQNTALEHVIQQKDEEVVKLKATLVQSSKEVYKLTACICIIMLVYCKFLSAWYYFEGYIYL